MPFDCPFPLGPYWCCRPPCRRFPCYCRSLHPDCLDPCVPDPFAVSCPFAAGHSFAATHPFVASRLSAVGHPFAATHSSAASHSFAVNRSHAVSCPSVPWLASAPCCCRKKTSAVDSCGWQGWCVYDCYYYGSRERKLRLRRPGLSTKM